jgi:hypothetical protein
MYERFTDRARKVMQLANQEAQRFNHEYIATEHVLLGLLKGGGGVAAKVLIALDLDLFQLRSEVEKIIRSGPDHIFWGKLPATPVVKKTIEHAIEEAKNLNHKYVGTEHLLLGLLRERDGVAAQVLMNLGLKLEDVRAEVLKLLGSALPAAEEKSLSPTSPVDERIQALERQLCVLSVLLGGLVGALVGALLDGGNGALRGWIVGALVVCFGEIPAALAGGIAGVLLAAAYLPSEIEWVLAGLWGAITGMFLTDMGRAPGGRGFLRRWWKR